MALLKNSTAASIAGILTATLLMASPVGAEDVTIYRWEGTRSGEQSLQLVYSGTTGMVTEDLRPTVSATSGPDATS